MALEGSGYVIQDDDHVDGTKKDTARRDDDHVDGTKKDTARRDEYIMPGPPLLRAR